MVTLAGTPARVRRKQSHVESGVVGVLEED